VIRQGWGRVEDRQGSFKEYSLKLTAKAPENVIF